MPQAAELYFPDQVWAGDEPSLLIARQAHALIMQAGPYTDDDEEELPYNYELMGNVGVVKIRGSLVNSDSRWNRYYGVMSYNEIRAAIVAAVNDSGAESILLDIGSGGGAVAGVSDTAEFIAMVDKTLKPVYSFSDSSMASAAYWLGVSGRAVYNTKTAVMGSIGVITSHTDYSQMRQKAGITDTVLRAGKFKSLANPMEPLSEEGRKQIEDLIGAVYGAFRGHVAAQLSVTEMHAEENLAQGRIFIGQAAVDVGLSKGVRNFESVLSQLQSEAFDAIAKRENNGRAYNLTHPMKTSLNPTQLAAVTAALAAAGVTVTQPTAEETAAAAAAAATAATTPPASDKGVVDFLRTELAAANEKVTSLTVELTGVKAKADSMTATHDALVKLAVKSLSTMKVALGSAAVTGEGLTAEQVLADHASTEAAFTAKFKAGGLAAVTPEEETTNNRAEPDAHYQARLRATSLR